MIRHREIQKLQIARNSDPPVGWTSNDSYDGVNRLFLLVNFLKVRM